MTTTEFKNRIVISICGPSGTGKSQTAVALIDKLGRHRSVRIPTDYFLIPAPKPLDEFLREPLKYDWPVIEQMLALPVGTPVETPQFDFETFQRTATSGGLAFTLQSISVVDAMYPCPFADINSIIHTPPDVRRARIAGRDSDWGTNVLRRWDHLRICEAYLDALDVEYDLVLAGTQPIDSNAERINQFVRERL